MVCRYNSQCSTQMPRRERQDYLSVHGTYTHKPSRLSGKQDEMERKAKREREPCGLTTHLCRCLLQCFLLGEAAGELGGCSQIAFAERQKRRRVRKRKGGREGKVRREWWVGLSSTLPCQCVCPYGWVHECVRERGRMGKRERETEAVSACKSPETMPVDRDWGTVR